MTYRTGGSVRRHGAPSTIPLRHPAVAPPPSGAAWAELARKAEDLGYDTLFMPDHFGDQLAPVPALMAAADATTELKVGCARVRQRLQAPGGAGQGAGHHRRAVGRAARSSGIGAGWMASDYEQSGIPMDRPGVRVTRMEEGIAVLKGCFADGAVLLRGRALHDHRLRRACPSPCSRRRRSSSAAAPSGCCRSRRARRRSSASTRRSTAATSTPPPPRTAPPTRPTRRSRGCGRRPATATPTSRSTCSSSPASSPTTARAPPR